MYIYNTSAIFRVIVRTIFRKPGDVSREGISFFIGDPNLMFDDIRPARAIASFGISRVDQRNGIIRDDLSHLEYEIRSTSLRRYLDWSRDANHGGGSIVDAGELVVISLSRAKATAFSERAWDARYMIMPVADAFPAITRRTERVGGVGRGV